MNTFTPLESTYTFTGNEVGSVISGGFWSIKRSDMPQGLADLVESENLMASIEIKVSEDTDHWADGRPFEVNLSVWPSSDDGPTKGSVRADRHLALGHLWRASDLEKGVTFKASFSGFESDFNGFCRVLAKSAVSSVLQQPALTVQWTETGFVVIVGVGYTYISTMEHSRAPA